MFEKNKCPRCDFFVKQSWNFCPHCGSNLKEIAEPKMTPLMMNSEVDMNAVFNDVNKMLKSMLGETPFKGSLSITQFGGPNGPKINVNSSGDYKKVEPEIKKKLGVKKRIRSNKKTEEPSVKIKEMPHENIIEINIPGVKKEEDIEIIKLKRSIEIRAFAKNKTYFKLIPLPENIKGLEKELIDGVLTLIMKK